MNRYFLFLNVESASSVRSTNYGTTLFDVTSTMRCGFIVSFLRMEAILREIVELGGLLVVLKEMCFNFFRRNFCDEGHAI